MCVLLPELLGNIDARCKKLPVFLENVDVGFLLLHHFTLLVFTNSC
jgi:hypothetical protein